MAPNVPVPQRHTWEEREESSREAEVVVPLVPEVFLPHLPQHFQDPDSPNLHILQRHDSTRSTQKPTTRSQTARSTLKALRQPTEVSGSDLNDGAFHPSSVSVLEDLMINNRRNTDSTHLRPQNAARPKQETTTVASGVPFSPNGGSSIPDDLRPPPSISPGVTTMGETQDRNFKPITGIPEGSAVTTRSRGQGRAMSTITRRPTSTMASGKKIDPGFLKLPGHEPEAPADLVLVHHDRAIDTHNQTGLNGILVKDESSDVTPEAATALILVGICIVFLVFICFIMFVQKIRRQKLQKKVEQSGEPVKPQTTYETTSSTPHPNPLSLLPPAFLHALALATTHKDDDPAFSSFLTMEPPPQNSNSLGRLWFCVYYDYVESKLVLRVLHARYTKGRGSSTNPGEVWVEACVLTSMNTIKASTKTGTRRASSAPVFNQTFRFAIDDDEVTQYLLRLTMYDRHPQSGEKAVGAVIVPLSTVDLCSDATLSRDLQ